MVSICDAMRSYQWMWLHRTGIWATHFHHRWFVAGSILTMLIPAFPLISLYLPPSKRFWPTAEAYIVPVDDHAAAYSLLVGCGIFYILGSLFLVRFVKFTLPLDNFITSSLRKFHFRLDITGPSQNHHQSLYSPAAFLSLMRSSQAGSSSWEQYL